MTPLQIIGIIYGIGAMFMISLFMLGLAGLLATRPFKDVLKKTPRILVLMVGYSAIWPYLAPVLLYKDSGFREIVVECGRVALPFLYCSMVVAPIYPMIIVWFILIFGSWLLLERYHEKQLVKTRE